MCNITERSSIRVCSHGCGDVLNGLNCVIVCVGPEASLTALSSSIWARLIALLVPSRHDLPHIPLMKYLKPHVPPTLNLEAV